MQRRILFLFCLLLPFLAEASDLVHLSALTIRPTPNSTRMIFTLSEKTIGHLKYIPAPDRLTLELEHTYKNFNLDYANLGGSLVQSIVAVPAPPDTLRFVFKVSKPVKWNINFVPTANHKVNLEIEIIALPTARVMPPQKLASTSKAITAKVSAPISAPPTPATLAATTAAKEITTDVAALIDRELVGRSRLELQRTRSIKKSSQFIVVVDAGHGGHDTGAIGSRGQTEKSIVLAIAKQLANKINSAPNMRAVLTRRGDYFVTLRQRLDFARKHNADLFIAVHADAYFEKRASGASVYALSQRGATSEAARWLAQRDNYSELGSVELSALKDRSPMLRSVLIDLAQTATIKESIWLGNRVLDALDDVSRLHYSHVEQAPFVVLKSPDIPSILVETGFITNDTEALRLATPAYQERIAHSIYAAYAAIVIKISY